MTRLADLNETRDQVDAAFHALGRATAKLHYKPLAPGEGQTLGGLMFTDAPVFVIKVGKALIENERGDHGEDLFPDITLKGAEILAEQDLADAWLTLRDRLARLSKLADQTHLKIQGEVLQKAHAVVKQIEMTAALPMPPPRPHYHQDRRIAMLPALIVLATYRQSLQKKKADKKKRGDQVSPPVDPGGPGGPGNGGSPGGPGNGGNPGGPGNGGNPGGPSPSGDRTHPGNPGGARPSPSPRKRQAGASPIVPQPFGFQALFHKFTMETHSAEPARPPAQAGNFFVLHREPDRPTTEGMTKPPSDSADRADPADPSASADRDAARPQPPTATAPADADADVKAAFAARYHLSPPTFEDALAIPIGELHANKAAAAAAFKDIPDIVLTDEQRAELSGRRYAEIGEISNLVANGLDKHPDIAQATGVTPKHLRQAAGQDNGATVLFTGATKLTRGGGDGAILTAALMEELSGQVLSQVRDECADPHTSHERRSALEDGFAEPFLLQAQHRQAPHKSQAEDAESEPPQHGHDPQRDRAGPAAALPSLNATASSRMIR